MEDKDSWGKKASHLANMALQLPSKASWDQLTTKEWFAYIPWIYLAAQLLVLWPGALIIHMNVWEDDSQSLPDRANSYLVHSLQRGFL